MLLTVLYVFEDKKSNSTAGIVSLPSLKAKGKKKILTVREGVGSRME